MSRYRPGRQHRPARLAPASRTAEGSVVAAALSALPPQYSSVLVEIFYRSRSVPDTAELLGVSPDTVKVRCYDALRAFRHELAERGIAA